jgi:hypothetical protein
MRARRLDPALLLTVQDTVVVQVTHSSKLLDSGQFVADDDLTWFRPTGFSTRCETTIGKRIKEIWPHDFVRDDDLLVVAHNGMHARARARRQAGDSAILHVRHNIRALVHPTHETHH